MVISFTKMQGLGNDFVVIDAIHQKIVPTPALINKIVDRHYGIGCDQVLLIEPAKTKNTDFLLRIFNNDGSEAEQCGNGARCVAKFLQDKNLSKKNPVTIGTISNRTLDLYLENDGNVSVNMGEAIFIPEKIPFHINNIADTYTLLLEKKPIEFGVVSVGNPHAVIKIEDQTKIDAQKISSFLANHTAFPQSVNVEFMEVIARNKIRLRVFERGSGETLACGSGATAAVAIGQHWHILDAKVEVMMRGGNLIVQKLDKDLWLTGPAVKICDGTLYLT